MNATHTNNPAVIEAALVKYIRRICAHEFNLPLDHPFFECDYLEGETADEALVRLFNQERQSHESDDETVLTLCHG